MIRYGSDGDVTTVRCSICGCEDFEKISWHLWDEHGPAGVGLEPLWPESRSGSAASAESDSVIVKADGGYASVDHCPSCGTFMSETCSACGYAGPV